MSNPISITEDQLAEIVSEYFNKGFTAPLPLPAGKKTPPPRKTTGRVPDITPEQVLGFWEQQSGGSHNVAIRMQTYSDAEMAKLRQETGVESFDIIGIDVDHYNGKKGADHIAELEAKLGPLDRMSHPRSSRRGAENPGGHSFFRVPRGFLWKSAVCPDVDLLQKTHRYALVYPSVVDNLQYQWYLGEEICEIPSVMDLPWLPQTWVDYLSDGGKSTMSDRKPGAISQNADHASPYRTAVDWMRKNFYNFGSNTLSPRLLKACDSEGLKEDLENNGHDTMVHAVHNIIMYGVDGEAGVKLALQKLGKHFFRAVVGDGRREPEVAKQEFYAAIIGDVEKISADVESGKIHLVNPGEIAEKMQKLSEKMADSTPEEKATAVQAELDGMAITDPPVIDWRKYDANDVGFAEMVSDYWGTRFLACAEGGSREFVLLNTETMRYSDFMYKDRALRIVYEATSQRLKAERDRLRKLRDILNKRAKAGGEGSLSQPETNWLDNVDEEIKYLTKLANKTATTSQQRAILAQMHAMPGHHVDITHFDTKKGLVGLGGAKTLDLSRGKMVIRDSVPEDRLSMSTACEYIPGAKHAAFDKYLQEFLPDEELRRFTQKCLGYSLVSGNPEKLLFIFHGESDTGKTTLLQAVAAALGDYAGPLSAQKVFGQDTGAPNAELLLSMNRRAVILSEMGERSNLSADALKRATGNDAVSLRLPHSQNVVEGQLQFTLYASTNTPPYIPDADAATLRRMCTIPFTRQHRGGLVKFEDDIVNNPEVLPTILAWIIEGLEMYLAEGLPSDSWPAAIKSSTRAISQGANYYTDFIEEVCEVTENEPVTDEFGTPTEEEFVYDNDIKSAWNRWVNANGLAGTELSDLRKFRKRIRSLGVEIKRCMVDGERTYKYIGMRLCPQKE